MNRKATAALFILLCALGMSLAASPEGILTGERVNLSTSPLWVTSGAWESKGSLLLVDVLASKVRRYGTDGQYLGDVLSHVRNGASEPTSVHAAERGSTIWVENEDAYLVKLNESLRPTAEKDLKALAIGPNGALKALYQWVPGDTPSTFLAFGDVLKGERGFSAFLWVSLANPDQFQVLHEIPLNDPARRYCLLGYPSVAVVNGKPYYLVMDDAPYIGQPGGRRIRFMQVTPQGRVPFRAPELPERRGMETTRISFERLEASSMPAAIYGWRGQLFVLMRNPSEEGKTSWRLLKLDPENGSILWNRLLDTKASHLLVIPGDRYWGIIEKGPVLGPGQQKIESLLLVPASAIEK